ncbi:hypothetical protein DESA109040_22950 [Deinococcus saxicola]
MDTMNAVVGMHPVGKFSELAGLFQTGEVNQEFQSGALMGLLSPPVLQRLESVLAHYPAELTSVPGGVIEKAAER